MRMDFIIVFAQVEGWVEVLVPQRVEDWRGVRELGEERRQDFRVVEVLVGVGVQGVGRRRRGRRRRRRR